MNWKIFKWRSLKTRVTLLTLAIVIAGIWGPRFYAARILQEDIQRLASEQQFSTASFIAGEIDQELESRFRALSTIAAEVPPAVLGNTAALQKLLEQRPVFASLFNFGVTATRTDGTVIAEVPRSSGRIGVNYMDRDYMVGALKEGKATIGRPVMGRALKAPVFVMAVPIRDPQQNVIGTLAGVVNLGKPNFLDRITEGHYGKTGGFHLVAAQHRLIVAASDMRRIMEALPAPGINSIVDRNIAGYEGTDFLVNALGEEVLVSIKRVPAAGWYVAVTLPKEEVFGPVRSTQQRMLQASLFFTLLAGGLAWWMLRRQLSPILAAVKALGSLSAADARLQPLPVARADEVGELVAGFNRLLEILAQREAELKGSEERLSAIFRASPIGVVLSRLVDGRILDINDAALRMYGYSREQVIGRTVAELGVYAKPAQREEIVRRLREQGGVDLFPVDFRNSSGVVGAMEVSVRTVELDGEQCLVGMMVDMTERRRSELVLAQLGAIVEHSEDAIISRDLDFLIRSWNPAAERLFGYAAGEVIGKNINILIPEDRLADVEHRRALFARGNPLPTYDSVRLARDGRRIDVSITQSSIMDADGKLIGISLILRDITERKRSAAIVERERMRLQTILKMASDGIHVMDGEGLLVEANDAFLNMLGYDRSAIGRLHVADWSGLESPEVIKARNDELIARRGQVLFEAPVRRRDGVILDMEINAAGIEIEGKGYLYAAFRDITARKQAEAKRTQLEEQLREAQKMQAIGTLAGGIAHDFNNIIATILGNVDLARQDASANPLALESLEEIHKAGSRARDLVHQILAFSRRELTERRRIALEPVVEETGRLLRATLPARVAIEVQCNAGGAIVQADPTQIQQVLINLATNAMQAMRGAPGHIVIGLDVLLLDAAAAAPHPALVALRERKPGRMVRLTVKDDGPGMDAATLARIFEPFFTTKPVDEGTGLGLAVVHGIVQGHEGVIVAESQPGKGASFAVYLPVAVDQAAEPAPESEAAAAPAPLSLNGGQHILYLDDDESLLFLLKRLLERRGYRVSCYLDQGEALAALRAKPAAFDLVVSDYNMPGMSGLDVAREVRLIRADLPVAIASGFIDETLRTEACGAGVLELLFKADAVEEFCAVVQRLAQAVSDKSKAS